jgi:hypothetical protein
MLSQNSCDYGSAVAFGLFIGLIIFAIVEFCRGIWGKEK